MINGLSVEDLIKISSYQQEISGHRVSMAFSLFILLLVGLSSCNQAELKEPVEYKGPLRVVENVELYYSEKDVVKVKMTAPLIHEKVNGDKEFPKGVYMEFFDEMGKLEYTLRANHAYYFKEENKWRGRGKVEVKNIAKGEQLNTEELFWKPAEEKILTDKFVTIRQQDDVLYGQGLDAKQDLSDYTLLKPEGDISIKE
jgi:LPS export ABC transporter protein LptC